MKAEVRFRAEVVSPSEWERSVPVHLNCKRVVGFEYTLNRFSFKLKFSPFVFDVFLKLIRWIRDQQTSEGVIPGEDVYIILRLDGRVRRSGRVSASCGDSSIFMFLLTLFILLLVVLPLGLK